MTLRQSGEVKLCCIKKQTRNLSGLTHKHLFLAREKLGGLVEAGWAVLHLVLQELWLVNGAPSETSLVT